MEIPLGRRTMNIPLLYPFLMGLSGMLIGMISAYFIIKRLLREETFSLITLFGEAKEGQELKEMIHELSAYNKGEEANQLREDIKIIIENVKRFTLTLNKRAPIIELPEKKKT